MKITKSRLKEIVREELLTEQKGEFNYKAMADIIIDYIVDDFPYTILAGFLLGKAQ